MNQCKLCQQKVEELVAADRNYDEARAKYEAAVETLGFLPPAAAKASRDLAAAKTRRAAAIAALEN